MTDKQEVNLSRPRLASIPARRTCDDAFTLIEIMIVVAIIGIVTALLLPEMGATNMSRLSAAANVMAADIDYARVYAITHSSTPPALVINSTTEYSIAPFSTTNSPITNLVTNQPYTVTYGTSDASQFSGVTIQSYSLGGTNTLEFGIYGQLQTLTTNATITLASSTHTALLTVNYETGQVTVGAVN